MCYNVYRLREDSLKGSSNVSVLYVVKVTHDYDDIGVTEIGITKETKARLYLEKNPFLCAYVSIKDTNSVQDNGYATYVFSKDKSSALFILLNYLGSKSKYLHEQLHNIGLISKKLQKL